ncbi:hypothetical protein SAMN05446589_7863 [Streptomyces sp. OV198]|uniref:hypothetical protein n=1 Tax=Streptomyces sp. OV198 TaxID=1882787 RepID=UPI000BC45369|nr:hypothetical protein [Streptomyces sp. OV198]SOE78198.1 hypothetical protein SAMN05446589_7863 [Streptomyces sp. OV198]
MVSIHKRYGATALASVLLAGSIVLPATAAAADPGLSTKPTTPAAAGYAARPAAHTAPTGSVILLQYTDTFTVSHDIRFGGGVPVGGWSALTLHSNGTYNWTGHVHDSGFTGYNFSRACVVRFHTGDTYIFDVRGTMGGTIGGSRDFNWQKSGRLRTLPTVWDKASGYKTSCSSRASLDVGGTIQSAKDAMPYVMTVLAVVAA